MRWSYKVERTIEIEELYQIFPNKFMEEFGITPGVVEIQAIDTYEGLELEGRGLADKMIEDGNAEEYTMWVTFRYVFTGGTSVNHYFMLEDFLNRVISHE